MKLQSLYTAIVLVFISHVSISQVIGIEYETERREDAPNHSHVHPTTKKPSNLTQKTLYSKFDYNAALAEFNALGLPLSERHGFIHSRKMDYLRANHPYLFENKNKPDPNFTGKSTGCTNAGFEDLVFQPRWEGGISTYNIAFSNTTIVSNGLNAAHNDPNSRHTILTTPPINNNPANGAIVGYDPVARDPANGLAKIPNLAPNGKGASVRLGNANDGAEIERLRYKILVNNDNRAFYYQFAIVLQDPNHSETQQPYFKISFKDASGAFVGGDCAVYNVNATLARNDTSFKVAQTGTDKIIYRQWKRIDVDLSSFIGQEITVEFETADCSQGGHFGYAYIDAGCLENIDNQVNFCAGDSFAQLVAQPGFKSYQWYGPNDPNLLIPGATSDTLNIPSPTINDTFYVEITSTGTCFITQRSILIPSTMELVELNTTNTCFGGAVGDVTAVMTGSNQGYTFEWQPVNQFTSVGYLDNLASGNYTLKVTAPNANCGQIDTSFTISFAQVYPTTVSAKFCESIGKVEAPNSNSYKWYDDNQQPIPAPLGTSQTIIDSNAYDGKKYYLVYELSNGCFDSLIYQFYDSKVGSLFTFQQGTNFCRNMAIAFDDYTPLTKDYTFSINGPGFSDTIVDTLNNFTYTGLNVGTYQIRMVDEGCFYDSLFVITDFLKQHVDTLAFCPDEQFNLSSFYLAPTHVWYNPNGDTISVQASSIQTISIPGLYRDSAQVTPGCYALTDLFFDPITYTSSYTIVNSSCKGIDDASIDMTIVTSNSAPFTLETSGPNGFVSNQSNLTNLKPGQYIVRIKISTCNFADTLLVTEPDFEETDISYEAQVCPNSTYTTLKAPLNFSDYRWYQMPDSILIGILPNQRIPWPTNIENYLVVVMDTSTGCDLKLDDFQVQELIFEFVPQEVVNVFTPNTDGKNDKYYPFKSDFTPEEIAIMTESFNIKIINRWGNLVYESNDYAEGWDGKVKNRDVDDGVYYVRIKYALYCAEISGIQEFSTDLHILR
ncbi:MAG: gliding motility-associated C-terminal domain-containing protein [Bacteroidetes bacterium]|nr:gliding motility-associated C-terminal domain-containing protein [Bacteroidota bacterium]